MNNRLACTAALSIGLVTTACGSGMNTPDIKQNPNLTKRYEITLTIHGATRGFDSVDGFAHFEIGNSEACSSKDPISGLYRTLDQHPPLSFGRVDENTYRTTVDMDYYVDADYFGMGVCHWTMTDVVAVLKINGNAMDLGADMSVDDIAAQGLSDRYFPLSTLSSNNKLKMSFPGSPLSDVPPERRKDYFYIAMSARKVAL